jgi:protein ImuB
VAFIANDIKTTRQFHNCGVQTLGDYMRLPRKDVNRRFGLQPQKRLQQALGEQPELLQYYQPPQPFSKTWHLDDAVIHCVRIEKIAEQLLHSLQNYLQTRCAAVQHVNLQLTHADKRISDLRIGSSHYQRNINHLKRLLHERLHNYVLKEPVTSVCLRADEIHVLPAGNMDLFAVHNNNQQAWQQLLDILQTRLGQQAIQNLTTYDDPRPEYAYRFNAANNATQSNHPDWPFWLLETPHLLDIAPLTTGLKPETGAERIEQGWWDGNDVRRDYYRVQHTHGEKVWVFQDCRSKQWFLHGLYG